VWKLAESLINNSNEAYLIFDDCVQDKGFSKKIERVKRQQFPLSFAHLNDLSIYFGSIWIPGC